MRWWRFVLWMILRLWGLVLLGVVLMIAIGPIVPGQPVLTFESERPPVPAHYIMDARRHIAYLDRFIVPDGYYVPEPDGPRIAQTRPALNAVINNTEWPADQLMITGLGDDRLIELGPYGTGDVSGSPVWSPDGRWLALSFRRDFDDDTEILLVDTSSGAVRQLTDNTVADSEPAWSPDGQWLVFQSNPQGYWDLILLHVESGESRPLAPSPFIEGHPAWSPDGEYVAFVSDRDGKQDLYSVNIDSGQIQQLTDHPAIDTRPAWSPDGHWLAFVSNRANRANWDIYLLHLANGAVERLTTDPAADQFPAWWP